MLTYAVKKISTVINGHALMLLFHRIDNYNIVFPVPLVIIIIIIIIITLFMCQIDLALCKDSVLIGNTLNYNNITNF